MYGPFEYYTPKTSPSRQLDILSFFKGASINFTNVTHQNPLNELFKFHMYDGINLTQKPEGEKIKYICLFQYVYLF